VFARTLLLSGGVAFADAVIAYPCALTLARLDVVWRSRLILLISFPLVTSLLLRIYGWINLLPLEFRGTLPAVALVMAVNYLPFMLLPLLRSVERTDQALTSAALDLGATPWQAFWRVTWPLTRPGLAAGTSLVFIPACGEYLVPHFLGEGKVALVGTMIVQEFMEHRNWPLAAACAAMLMLLVLGPLVLITLRGSESREASWPVQ
jgi:ABC-type spermidine/putrescine transport system permease subunit I